jgi:hypothetical protein
MQTGPESALAKPQWRLTMELAFHDPRAQQSPVINPF